MREIKKIGQTYFGVNNPVQALATLGKNSYEHSMDFSITESAFTSKSYTLVSWTQMQMITLVSVLYIDKCQEDQDNHRRGTYIYSIFICISKITYIIQISACLPSFLHFPRESFFQFPLISQLTYNVFLWVIFIHFLLRISTFFPHCLKCKL